jgi:hypothetical protein
MTKTAMWMDMVMRNTNGPLSQAMMEDWTLEKLAGQEKGPLGFGLLQRHTKYQEYQTTQTYILKSLERCSDFQFIKRCEHARYIYQQGTRKSQEYQSQESQTAQNKVTKSLERCESANYQQDFV